jgi:hypothetical protein
LPFAQELQHKVVKESGDEDNTQECQPGEGYRSNGFCRAINKTEPHRPPRNTQREKGEQPVKFSGGILQIDEQSETHSG